MNNEQARTKLAEAMNVCLHCNGWNEWCKCVDCGIREEDARDFDPFTDANDDYAVLEWMYEKYGGKEIVVENGVPRDYEMIFESFCDALPLHSKDYGKGDYARAALKAINDD